MKHGKGADPPKMKLIFHVAPEEAGPQLIAMFLSAATHVHDLARKMPETTSYPIHVAIEMGGKKLCGDIEPASPGDAEGLSTSVVKH